MSPPFLAILGVLSILYGGTCVWAADPADAMTRLAGLLLLACGGIALFGARANKGDDYWGFLRWGLILVGGGTVVFSGIWGVRSIPAYPRFDPVYVWPGLALLAAGVIWAAVLPRLGKRRDDQRGDEGET